MDDIKGLRKNSKCSYVLPEVQGCSRLRCLGNTALGPTLRRPAILPLPLTFSQPWALWGHRTRRCFPGPALGGPWTRFDWRMHSGGVRPVPVSALTERFCLDSLRAPACRARGPPCRTKGSSQGLPFPAPQLNCPLRAARCVTSATPSGSRGCPAEPPRAGRHTK